MNYTQIHELRIKNINFSASLLARYLDLIPNKTFNLGQWELAQQKLAKNPYFKIIKVSDFERSEKGLDLFFYLKKKKNSSVNGLVAFKGNNKKTDWIGNFRLSLSNIFNRLENIQINWQSLPNYQKKMKLNLTLPFLFNTGYNLYFKSEYEQFDSSLLRLETVGQLSYSINNNWQTFINIENFSSVQNSPEKTAINYYLKGFGMKYQLERKYFEIATKANAAFSNTDNKNRQKLEFELNLKFVLKNWQFYNLNSLLIKKYSEIKTSELSYLGGINSVIGYLPNTFFAKDYFHNRLKAEYKLSDKYKIISLSDILLFTDQEKKSKSAFGIASGFKIRKKNTAIEVLFAIPVHKNITNFPPANLNFKLINYF